MSKRKVELINRILSTLVFLCLVGVIAYFSRTYQVVSIGGNMLEVGRLLSLLTVIQILVTVYMTIYGGKPGYYIAILLLAMHMGIVIVGITKTGNLGSIPGVFMNFEAMIILTILHSYIKKINKIANTDMLTDLYNRRGLVEEVEHLMERKKRFAFILLDLDDFKKTNDLMGHDKGDDLLQQFAEQWRRRVQQEGAHFARLGGDEFVILLETKLSKEELKQLVKERFFQTADAANQRFQIGGEEISISSSIGISVYPDDASNYTDLYRYADVAMYHVKNRGKQNVMIFKPEMLTSVSGDFQLEQKIKKALQSGNCYVVFQPQFDADSETMIGAEALARIRDEEGNTISPYYFIPVAEKSRMIVDLDFFVVKSALQEFKPLLRDHPNLTLSVNFSVKTIFSKDFAERLCELVREQEFPTQNLMIEITESVLITARGKDMAIEVLKKLKEYGIRAALDDFGTGYSSLSYLMDLPIDTLKIDKSFIDKLSDQEDKNAYIKAVISMGHILKHNVIAEGIETREQLEILKSYECDQIQGFLLGKPMEMERFAQLAKK